MSEIQRYDFSSDGHYPSNSGGWVDADEAEAKIKQLEQELAEAKKDQARYCYAVENMLILSEEDGMFLVEKEAANKLIDAAIAAKESSK